MNIRVLLLAIATVATTASDSHAERNGCAFEAAAGEEGSVKLSASTVRLLARLVDPPRGRVTLSIDDTSGNHYELVWDPAVNDGLQHSILLPGTTDPALDRKWTFSPSGEDERIQTAQVVIVISTTFSSALSGAGTAEDALTLTGTRKHMTATVNNVFPGDAPGKPRIILSCEDGEVDMSSLKLDSRRVAAAVTARGLLDQAVPAPVSEALSLLAGIAIERAKSGAMQLIKDKFVKPICEKLSLGTLGLRGTTPALPQTCSLLEQMRLDDVLSSGKSLVAAIRDDVRLTIAPLLIDAVMTNDETRELARRALQFANRMIDGESSTVIAVDLLVSMLDRLAWSNGFERSQAIVFRWLHWLGLDADAVESVLEAALDRALPAEFWHDPTSPVFKLEACKRQYKRLSRWEVINGKFPDGPYYEPKRKDCLDALRRDLLPDVQAGFAAVQAIFGIRDNSHAVTALQGALGASYMKLQDLVAALRARTGSGLADYLIEYGKISDGRAATDALLDQLPSTATYALRNACAIRLVVGIAKWCSGRESCSAGDVADALDNPRKLFKPTTKLPGSLCWVVKEDDGTALDPGRERYLLPAKSSDFIDLAVRLVAFLQPPAKGEERTRALAMVRWLFAAVRAVNLDAPFDVRPVKPGAPRAEQPKEIAPDKEIEQIVGHLIEADYLRALTTLFALVRSACVGNRLCGEDLDPIRKALELTGAVASYVQTYEETKSLDAEAAHKARKKAIERLIDSTVNRDGRHGDTVWSIGAPVGFAAGGRLSAGDKMHYGSRRGAYDLSLGLQWRVPLSIARQHLPDEDGFCGTHVALWVADLGQFARTRPPGDEIDWTDFLGLGFQAGVVLGTSDHAVVLALEASWAPGLFARDVVIKGPIEARTEHVSGAFTFGATLAYYVPFFDLN